MMNVIICEINNMKTMSFLFMKGYAPTHNAISIKIRPNLPLSLWTSMCVVLCTNQYLLCAIGGNAKGKWIYF